MSDGKPATRPPAGIAIDLGPVHEMEDALARLELAWREVPAGARPGLSRLFWLHPSGEVVIYRPPSEE